MNTKHQPTSQEQTPAAVHIEGPEITLNDRDIDTPIWTAFTDDAEEPHFFADYLSALYWATTTAYNLRLQVINHATA